MRTAVMMLAVMFTVSVFAGEADELKQQARADRAEAQKLKDAASSWESEAREANSDGNTQNNKATALTTRAAFAKEAEKQNLLDEAAELRRSAQANFERARSLQSNARDNYTAASKYESRAGSAEVAAISAAVRDQQAERDRREAQQITKQREERQQQATQAAQKEREERRVTGKRRIPTRQITKENFHRNAGDPRFYTVQMYKDRTTYSDGTTEDSEEYEGR